MIVATLLVIMMAVPGLALFYGGLVRSKNMLSLHWSWPLQERALQQVQRQGLQPVLRPVPLPAPAGSARTRPATRSPGRSSRMPPRPSTLQ